jgi:hypothetical protein
MDHSSKRDVLRTSRPATIQKLDPQSLRQTGNCGSKILHFLGCLVVAQFRFKKMVPRMGKNLRLTKSPSTGKILVPIASSAGLASELRALTNRLSEDPGVKKFTVTVNKETGIAKATAVGHHGQTITQEVVGPGLTATMTYNPQTKAGKVGRDQNIQALYERGLTQVEIAERLNVSQSTVSNVLRRDGLR